MIKNFQIHDNKIVIYSNNQEYQKVFDRKIDRVIQHNDKLIVLLLLTGAPNQNILCLNEKAQVLWIVQDPDDYENGGKYKTRSPFGGTWITDDNLLGGQNVCGSDYYINIDTGKIVGHEFTK